MIKLIDPTYEDLGFDEKDDEDLSVKYVKKKKKNIRSLSFLLKH